MYKMNSKMKLITYSVLGTFLLFLFPAAGTAAQDGRLVGYVFAADGTTPVPGAVLKVENVKTGKQYQSDPANIHGKASFDRLESGVYRMGIQTDEGVFGGEGLMGINVPEGETAKVSIALNRYSKTEAEAVNALYQGDEDGAVGRVISYDAATGMAEIEIIDGFIEPGMTIEIRGETERFDQAVKNIFKDGQSVPRALKGDVVVINVKQAVTPGMLAFLKDAKPAFALFTNAAGKINALGVAVIVAGTAGIVYTVVKLTEEEPEASPFR